MKQSFNKKALRNVVLNLKLASNGLARHITFLSVAISYWLRIKLNVNYYIKLLAFSNSILTNKANNMESLRPTRQTISDYI